MLWLYHSVDFESLDNSSYYWIVIRNIKTGTRNILAFQKVTLSKTLNFLHHCFFIYKTEEQKYFLYRLAVKHYCWLKHFVYRMNFLNLNFISSTINFTLNTINLTSLMMANITDLPKSLFSHFQMFFQNLKTVLEADCCN